MPKLYNYYFLIFSLLALFSGPSFSQNKAFSWSIRFFKNSC